jgi:hypothetical protein
MWFASYRELGFDEWFASREEVSVSKIRFERAVTNEGGSIRRDRGGIGAMMKNHRHENHVNAIKSEALR